MAIKCYVLQNAMFITTIVFKQYKLNLRTTQNKLRKL